jgi:hypothetical protein
VNSLVAVALAPKLYRIKTNCSKRMREVGECGEDGEVIVLYTGAKKLRKSGEGHDETRCCVLNIAEVHVLSINCSWRCPD